MTEELKACTFCGSLSVREGCDTPDAKWHYVECDDCHATSKADLGVSGAIENWNTRPLEDALRTELDACKSVLADAETQRDMNGAEIDTLLKQLYDARYEANLANRGFETIEKQDTALRAQHVAEMDAKVEALEWRDREICTLRTKLDIAADKITVTLTHLREFDNVSHYHYCIDLAKITLDNALAEIEKGGRSNQLPIKVSQMLWQNNGVKHETST